MNDLILRGFCQICDAVFSFDLKISWQLVNSDPKQRLCYSGCEEIAPVLSPNQIKILTKSAEFYYWFQSSESKSVGVAEAIAEALNVNPFLVAKILSEAKE